jgi:YHS domain-containing protein
MNLKNFTSELVTTEFIDEPKEYSSIEEVLKDMGNNIACAFTTEEVGDGISVSISDDGERILILIHIKDEILHFEDIAVDGRYGAPHHDEHISSELDSCSVNIFQEEAGGRIKFKYKGKTYRYFWEED